ncbi:hypothetical protein G7084_03835 [Weissella coleopterorum]|uniref:Uncharacterized protein n=1 Tax=Weissella coleopterorum TaxID=2714949 RepID=A0A6G8AZX6_9LACO|nr:hypothetical protein [Weissella coleopterorum]QIL50519.1 hypothetical protein G7084_03835 [Weissella coleopterorum]
MNIIENWDLFWTGLATMLGVGVAGIDVYLGNRVHKVVFGDWNSQTLKSVIMTHAIHIGLPVFIILLIDALMIIKPETKALCVIALTVVLPVYGGVIWGDFNSLRGNLHLLGDKSFDKIDLSILSKEINHKAKKLED